MLRSLILAARLVTSTRCQAIPGIAESATMSLNNIALSEPDYQRIKDVLRGIQQELDSELVLLIHRNGQQIAFEGPVKDLDLTSLSSLAAASLAATDGLARIVG